MDAEKVFRLWRRVLRDPAYGDAVLGVDGRACIADLGLDAEEEAIVMALREHREAAYWPREGYRYRVISVAHVELHAHAPLTALLLDAYGVDLRALATRFAAATGWRDDGHHAYRTCLDFLAYIPGDPELPELAGLRDVLAVDAATCRLLRHVATLPPDHWHPPELAGELIEGRRYQRSPLTMGVEVEHAVTGWLEQLDEPGRVPLAREPQRIVIQFVSAEERPDYMNLGPTTYAMYQALQHPLPLDQAVAVLGQEPEAEALARATLRNLVQADIVRPSPG